MNTPVEASTPVERKTISARPLHLLALSAASKEALASLSRGFTDYMADHPDINFADVCFAANTRNEHDKYRLAVLADDCPHAVAKLKAHARGDEPEGVFTGNATHHKDVVFLCTGQGAQYIGMGKELYDTQPVFRRAFHECEKRLAPRLEIPLSAVVYPDIADDSLLDRTIYSQPALFAIEYALAALWRSWGITPSVVMGHSLGEYMAAYLAGVFSLDDGLKLVSARSRLMEEKSDPGQMVTVFGDEQAVTDAIAPFAERVSIAAINGPLCTVISGCREMMRKVLEILEADHWTIPLAISHAFHSPLTEAIRKDYSRVVDQVSFSPARVKVISNITGTAVSNALASTEYWLRHLSQPVRFMDSMKTLHTMRHELFLEIGPEPLLLGLDQCLPSNIGANPETPIQWIPSLRKDASNWETMLSGLAGLYVSGVAVAWMGFDAPYGRSQVALPDTMTVPH